MPNDVVEWALKLTPILIGIAGGTCTIASFFLQKQKTGDEFYVNRIKTLEADLKRAHEIIEKLRAWARSRPDYNSLMDEI